MSVVEVRVPNIGGFKDVGVIDVLVKPGDAVKADESLLTLESDKATMDVPSPLSGTVQELRVQVGDRVSEGAIILTMEAAEGVKTPAASRRALASGPVQPVSSDGVRSAAPVLPAAPATPRTVPASPPTPGAGDREVRVPAGGDGRRLEAHASPSVRRAARELGVDLTRVPGSGPKGRILHEDVRRFVKEAMRAGATAGAGGAGLDLLPWPRVDFTRFGPVEARPLSRIRKISGANLARNWVMIPHVTQFDEADVTELEAFRLRLVEEGQGSGVKVTLLAFLIKACVAALRRFPELNASLDGESLVLKRYFHLGFAADTPNGLVVPVIRDADQKGVLEVARELAELSGRARAGKLAAADLQGGSFSISSLGGIGGTAFTPIINAPEVAVLGVSRIATRPVWDGERFQPRRMLPLSLSYDHRVIDGAMAARFTAHLSEILGDMRRAML